MKTRRHDLLCIFILIISIPLITVCILYIRLHQDFKLVQLVPNVSVSLETLFNGERLYSRVSHINATTSQPMLVARVRRQLSIAVVVHKNGLKLQKGPKDTKQTIYISQGTLLLLDIANSLILGDSLAIEVLHPISSWIRLGSLDIQSNLQFISLSNVTSHARLEDYEYECNANLIYSKARICSLSDLVESEHGVFRVLKLGYAPIQQALKFNHSSFRLNTKLSNGDWTQQIPIGNGKLGAFIGGNSLHEVLPVSLSDIYEYQRSTLQPRPNTPQAIPDDVLNQPSIASSLFRARSELLSGRIPQAVSSMSNLRHGALGMFQGVADVLLVYSDIPIVASAKPDISVVRSSRFKGFKPSKPGRRGVVDKMRSDLGFTNQPPHQVLHSQSGLDMRAGIAFEQLLHIPAGSQSNDRVHWHHREWFISQAYDVLIGRLQCQSLLVDRSVLVNSTSDACLNAAIQLRRDGAGKLGVPVSITSEKVSMTRRMQQALLPTYPLHNMALFVIDMSFQSTPEVCVPPVHVQMHVVCGGDNTSADYSLTSEHIITCNGADEMTIVLTAAKQDVLGLQPDQYEQSAAYMTGLRKQCQQKLDAVYTTGLDQIRAEHVHIFSKHMSRARLDLTYRNKRLDSSHPSHPEKSLSDDSFSSLAPVLFQYSRYLLLSTATQSVANLQGLWADGLQSAWNGDYHLNINLQMIYSSMYATGIHEAASPLLKFIHKISQAGTIHQLGACKCADAASVFRPSYST
jgi:hypothetical protein